MSRPLSPILAALLTLLTAGCESEEAPPHFADDVDTVPSTAPARTVWRTVEDSEQLALPADAKEARMQEAIAEAHRTVEQARLRWQAQQRSGESNGATWAVKWRAPTVDDGVEHVWVEPLSWSQFRIEGRLASPPQRELACGKSRDELVGFPAEEMVDWVRYEGRGFEGAYEGGFTMGVLDAP